MQKPKNVKDVVRKRGRPKKTEVKPPVRKIKRTVVNKIGRPKKAVNNVHNIEHMRKRALELLCEKLDVIQLEIIKIKSVIMPGLL